MPAADNPIPYGSVAEPLAIASMLVGSTLWGLYWLPLRLLEQVGLAGPWAIMLVYTGATGLLLVLARKELPALRRFVAPMLGIGVTAAVSGVAFSLGVIEGELVGGACIVVAGLAVVWVRSPAD